MNSNYRMIQDIAPFKYHVEYALETPDLKSTALIYKNTLVLVKKSEEGYQLPTIEEALALDIIKDPVSGDPEKPEESNQKDQENQKDQKDQEDTWIYLFRIDEMRFFLLNERYLKDISEEMLPEGYILTPAVMFRVSEPRYLAYAAATGHHLYNWYKANRFCGRCGHPMIRDKKERAVVCPACNFKAYPRINPSVIIGVIDRKKDRMLVTEYNPNHISDPNNPNARRMQARRPGNHYALVAGYIEIGESGEMCVEREVFEEVGMKVKNIRYFSSQPWAFSSSYLSGYICDLDGSDEIHIQEDELSRAVWLSRDEMEDRSKDSSLTSCIMEAFRTGKI